LVVSVVVLAGCGGGGTLPGDGGVPCRTDLDCDDGHECTIDSCGVSGVCRFDEIDERCPDGQLCEAGRGCVSSATCSSDAECDDSIACTIDSCGVGGICSHRPVNERCAAGETCDVGMGCTAPSGCSTDAECDDGVACTRDSCTVDRQCRNLALDELCDTAAGERCNQTRGCFTPRPCTIAADCDDGNFCNGAEVCIPEFGCEPAPTPRTCNDSQDCTVDRCDTTLDMCVFDCDRSRPACGCPAPPTTCSGRFTLPGTSGSCAFGLVSWNFTNVTFTNVGGAIEITGWTVASTGSLPPMADPGPACPNVDASTTLPGDCDETYRIRGTFMDDNTFTGTFELAFSGSLCFDCTSRSIPVTGTRVP
jgi:hypothetical protein